jgi:diaminopimelate epimerase
VSYAFLKGHGTENDFILLPDHDGSVHGDLSAERVRALCNRRAGIGGDGVLRVIRTAALDSESEWPAQPSPLVEEGLGPGPLVVEGLQGPSRDHAAYQQPEWFMDYRNSDGSHSEMCGNGIRVFARHLMEEGLVPDGEPVRIGTQAGVKTVTRDGEVYTVDIGTARILGETKVAVGDRSWPALHIDLGNPHAVVMVKKLADAGSLAHQPAYDESLFPEGVNVEFVSRRGPDHVAMRVHERGSGETRSCGTGACAAAVAVAGQGAAEMVGSWRVDVPGGTLTVSRDERGHVFLAGPAVIIARGTTDL